MVKNGWDILFHKVFAEQYNSLILEVAALRKKHKEAYKTHPKAELFRRAYKAVHEDVPANPFDKKYLLGNTLGKKCSHWRRAKNGLPKRHRLFFQADTTQGKKLVFAWLNVEAYLRKAGDKNDVYKVFRRLLDSGAIPSSFSGLLSQSSAPSA